LVILYALRSAVIEFLTAGCSVAALLADSLGWGEAAASRIMCWWGRVFIRLGGWSVRVEGMENLPPGGAVLVSNHQSLVDIPLLLFAFRRPVRFLAKRELVKIPLLGKAMTVAGALVIDRDDPRDVIRILRQASARLSAGELVSVFPEGRRTPDGAIGEFKPGAFYLAQMSGAPVVPVYIDGGFKALPKGARCFRPAHFTVRVLPPLLPEERAGATKERISELVRERIVAAASAVEGEGRG
jgi:1-acyl-sn-glycerol-3-phosphate acyltransferase